MDDDILLLETYKIILEMEGYNVIAASTPYKALQLINDENIRLAILDYNLPKMNGLQLGRLIHKVQKEVIIMFISGNPNIHKLVENADYKFFSVLTKPIEADHLASTVKSIMGESKTPRILDNKFETSKIQKIVRMFSIYCVEKSPITSNHIYNISI